MADAKQAIDEMFFTLYNSAAVGIDKKVGKRALSTEALRRIRKNLATLDAKTVKVELEKYKGRLEQFEEFLDLPREERERLLKKSRVEHAALEKVYTLSDGSRN